MQHQVNAPYPNLNISSLGFRVGEIVVVLLVPLILLLSLGNWAGGNPMKNLVVVWTSYIGMFAIIWLGLKIRGESWSKFGVTFEKPSLKTVFSVFAWSVLVCILAAAGFILGSIIMSNVAVTTEPADFTNYNYLKDNVGMLILTLAGVYVISSFGEELIFRAFLITRLTEILPDNKLMNTFSVILGAIIFGFAHYEWGPMGIVQTGFMGLVMGIAYVTLKRRLWILVLAHAYLDTILILQLYLGNG